MPSSMPRFHADMTVGEAIQIDTRVREILAAFHLGGCSSCGISEIETIRQVTVGYGVDTEMLLQSMNDLDPAETPPAFPH